MKINLHLTEKNIDIEYKDGYVGSYDIFTDNIDIYLFAFKTKNINKFIKNFSDTIQHETIHKCINDVSPNKNKSRTKKFYKRVLAEENTVRKMCGQRKYINMSDVLFCYGEDTNGK